MMYIYHCAVWYPNITISVYSLQGTPSCTVVWYMWKVLGWGEEQMYYNPLGPYMYYIAYDIAACQVYINRIIVMGYVQFPHVYYNTITLYNNAIVRNVTHNIFLGTVIFRGILNL